MRRAALLRAAVLICVLWLGVGSEVAAAQRRQPVPVYLRGYVRADCGQKGVTGATVQVYRVQTGKLKGASVVRSEFGDWGVMLSGTWGEYRIVVTLPEDSGGQVVEWTTGYGDMERPIAGPTSEVIWWLDQTTPLKWDIRFKQWVHGPISVYTDVLCTQPSASGPTYLWGKVLCANRVAAPPQECLLFREVTGGVELLSVKRSNPVGMFGFGITPVAARYHLIIGTGPGAIHESFGLEAGPGKGPRYLGEYLLPVACAVLKK